MRRALVDGVLQLGNQKSDDLLVSLSDHCSTTSPRRDNAHASSTKHAGRVLSGQTPRESRLLDPPEGRLLDPSNSSEAMNIIIIHEIADLL